MEGNTRKNYDSEFCGNVPLNFINSIQPYGVLMVLDRITYNVVQISENVKTIFGLGHETILGKNFSSFLSKEESETVYQKLALEGLKQNIPLHFTLLDTACIATVHFKEKQILLEIEKRDVGTSDFSTIYQHIKYIVALLKDAETTEHVCRIAAKEIKQLSGFDKVILYRFDEEWNGTVIAEEKEKGMDSYMGLRFPASDVPKQARDLYLKNPFRLIPDSRYTPSKLHPALNPLSFTFTDLADCNLRGVPAVHIEYLANMKVGASMSTPIVKDDKLWGLITCHHKTPRYLHHDIRSAFELLSNIISTQLASKEKEKLLLLTSRLEIIQSKLYKQMIAAKSFEEGLFQPTSHLLELLNVSGAAMLYEGQVKTTGNVPPDSYLKELAFWLKINNIEKTYVTDSVMQALDPAGLYKEVASGFIAIPLSPNKGEYILGFRPEMVQTVSWGGNPNNAINFEEDKKNYHPRNSFEIWKETVGNTCEPWQPATLKAAEDLQKSILEMIWRNKV